MNINLTEREVGVLVAAMTMTPFPKHLEADVGPLVWKLARTQREYDLMMAEATPLLLVERLRARRRPRPSHQSDASTVADASTVRPEAPTISEAKSRA